jgi:ribonuclease BN (tRNA processing enzyme)
LTVLGGSAAGANPGIGCSGYLVDDGETAIIVDLGPGTFPELLRHIDPRTVAGVVISHAHLDHTLDLGIMRFGLKYGPNPATAPVPVWIPESVNQVVAGLSIAFATDESPDRFFEGTLDFCNYDPDSELTIGSLSIRFAPGIHYVPVWAMRITSRHGGTLGYTADTGPAADLLPLLSGTDILLAEATLLEPGNEPYEHRGHLTAREAGNLARVCGSNVLVLTHTWHALGHDNLLREAASVYSRELHIARPGLRVTSDGA